MTEQREHIRNENTDTTLQACINTYFSFSLSKHFTINFLASQAIFLKIEFIWFLVKNLKKSFYLSYLEVIPASIIKSII